MKRRAFLQQSSIGLTAFGLSGLVLRADARPTPRSLDADEAEATLNSLQQAFDDKNKIDLKPTVARDLGPFYRSGAPFRTKLTPPFEPGTVLVVTGRIWSFETKKPLAGATLDLWQVDNQTRDYSAGGGGDFKNRARLYADENGYFEFETVHPVPYSPSANFWRSPHIHFIAAAAGHKRLVSEMFFKGDRKQDVDSLFHPSLAVAAEKKTLNGKEYETAVFDIVLEAEKRQK